MPLITHLFDGGFSNIYFTGWNGKKHGWQKTNIFFILQYIIFKKNKCEESGNDIKFIANNIKRKLTLLLMISDKNYDRKIFKNK